MFDEGKRKSKGEIREVKKKRWMRKATREGRSRAGVNGAGKDDEWRGIEEGRKKKEEEEGEEV